MNNGKKNDTFIIKISHILIRKYYKCQGVRYYNKKMHTAKTLPIEDRLIRYIPLIFF